MTKMYVPDATGSTLAAIFKPVSIFSSCLRGVDAIEVGLQHLGTSVGASSVILSRRYLKDDKSVVIGKTSIANAKGGAPLNPLCDNMANVNPWALRVGVCLFRSAIDAPSSASQSALDRWDRMSGTRDSLVMVLEVKKTHIDRLEMHFDHRLDKRAMFLCEEVAKSLPLFYDTRAPQIIEDTISRNKKHVGSAQAKNTGPILSVLNPYGLTRSEFRLCHVISRGASYRVLPEKLSISAHTVRSHLRSIYGKLDISDFYELSHRLVSIEERLASSVQMQIAS